MYSTNFTYLLLYFRSNFVGTEFVMYDKGNAPNPDGSSVGEDVRQELGVILYVRIICSVELCRVVWSCVVWCVVW